MAKQAQVPELMTTEQFETRLASFSKAIKTSQNAARDCAEQALLQFHKHGSLAFAEKFYAAMPKNFVRRAAFLKWMKDHSPFTVVEGTMKKDKSNDAAEWDIEGALSAPFWDYAPDPEQVYFGSDDVVVALRRTLKRYQSNENYHAASERAAQTVQTIDNFLDHLPETMTASDEAEAADETSDEAEAASA